MQAIMAAKVALLAKLNAVTWPGPLVPEVRYGQPTEPEDSSFNGEMAFLGESRVNAIPPGMGVRRDESFQLRYVIDVVRSGDDEQTTESRAWDLAQAAEDAIWSDPTIGGTVNRVTGIEAQQVNVPEPSAWHVQIVVDISCVAAPIY